MLSSPPLYQRRFLTQILPPTVLTFKTPQHHLNNPLLKANDSLPFGYGFFLLSLGICVALVAFSSLDTRLPMSKSRILLNPRDIDINMVNKSCNSWSSRISSLTR